MTLLATCLGYPRIGIARELKKALESHWSKKTSSDELLATASELRRRHWSVMKEAGLDTVPSNDFSLYDHMLDAAVLFGAIPARYRAISDPLVRYFAMARGLQDRAAGLDVAALEMTKWFDTNYHYIVPELESGLSLTLDASKILAEIDEARALGVEPRPVLPGPVTFLLLSKLAVGAPEGASTLDHLDALVAAYEKLFGVLAAKRVNWVQLDEPCLVLELGEREKAAYKKAFSRLAASPERPRVLLATYFGPLGDNVELATKSGFEALHVDLVRAPTELEGTLSALPATMSLSVGVVDGRNIWRTDLDTAHARVRRAVQALGRERVIVSSSCSLLHVPVDLEAEKKLDGEIRSWCSFARQKLTEIRALADAGASDDTSSRVFTETRAALATRRTSTRTRNADVRARVHAVTDAMLRRTSAFPERAKKQRARFGLPLFPTTTIGSFPQTSEVRKARGAAAERATKTTTRS